MSSPDWNAGVDLFTEVEGLAPDERERVLAARAAEEPELVAFVRRALQADPDADGFLASVSPATHGRTEVRDPGRVAGARFGDFELEHELGHGASSTVFAAIQHPLGRRVAIKLLAPHLAATATARARFEAEAQRVARLQHPAIARVLVVGDVRGFPYLAMEYVPGRTLSDHVAEVRRARAENRELAPGFLDVSDPRVATAIALEIADALAYCHGEGIVHRDVKPANVILDDAGHAHLVDFGVAKDLARGTGGTDGFLSGTPHYMSPEQAEARTGALDARTDLYSLGVVLYEMLALRRPFESDSNHVLYQQIVGERAPALHHLRPDVPRSLSAVCERALRKDPRDRYEDARSFADDLRAFRAGGRIAISTRMRFDDAYHALFVRYPWIPVSAALLLFAVVAVYPTRGDSTTSGAGVPMPAQVWVDSGGGFHVNESLLPTDDVERQQVMNEVHEFLIQQLPGVSAPEPTTSGS